MHLNYAKTAIIDLGPIKETIPVNDGIMPIDYGYIEDTSNVAEGDEVDVLIFSRATRTSGDKVEISPIGLIRRDDGDDKVLAVDATEPSITSWEDIPEKTRTLLLAYFGHHHKIIAIENKDAAEAYITQSLI